MPSVPASSGAVAWLPWSIDAFARARAEHKPVLLAILPTWCQWSREMDRTCYADASIAAFINDHFVPIRIDADRRPDISERYSLGGWPTTAFLSPDGLILGGGTFVTTARMPGVLTDVVKAFRARGDTLSRASIAAEDVQVASRSESPGIERIRRSVFDSFDEQHGGFGSAPKFPHAAPVRLAMERWRATEDSECERVATVTLDAMGWGGLYDEVDGGFFRCTSDGAWQAPRFEKLLDVNAVLLRLYLDAGAAFGAARFTERATDVLRYVQTWLADHADSGWSASQDADEAYYGAATIEARRTLPPPNVPRILYTDANAAMISAAIHAGRVLDDPGLTSFAIASLERVLMVCYRPGAGVAHYFDDEAGVRGLLADQIVTAAACLDAFEACGNIVYQMMAQELAHYAIRVLWDEQNGGFFDCTGDADGEPIGLMRQRIKPFVTNCDGARVLRRLTAVSGDQQFSSYAARTLEAMAPLVLDQGPLGAHYALALED